MSKTLPLPQTRPAFFWAGALYATIITAGLTAELGIRQQLINPSDAQATVAGLLAHPELFRSSIALDAVMIAADVGLAMALFVLFRPTSAALAGLATGFRFIQATILAGALMLSHAALGLVHSGGEDATVLLLLSLHADAYDLGLLFFALNSVLMAVLLWRCGFAPRGLAIGVGAAGLVYFAGSTVRFLAPQWSATFEPAYLIPIVAETWFCLWLLWQGFRSQPVRLFLRGQPT